MTIQAPDNLVIELWPAAMSACTHTPERYPGGRQAPGDSADRLMLKLRSLAAGQDGEGRVAVVYLPEARHLVAALVEAALELAEAETRHAKREPA
jgi:hypothetical protein